MEGMTGFEVLARLCAISPQTHVIVITGHEDTAARILAMQIGTVAFLIKPFDDEQFLEAVHRALGRPPESQIGRASCRESAALAAEAAAARTHRRAGPKHAHA